MKKSERNKIAASGAIHMAHDEGKKVAIAVDDDDRAKDMLKLVTMVAKKHGFDLGATVQGNGVITVPVGNGEVRIVSADHLPGASKTVLN